MAVVGDATPGTVLMVLAMPTVELEKDGMVPLERGVLVGKAPVPVGRAQVAQATLVETVIGITAVHGQSVMVIVVASVMVEVSEP